MTEITPDMMKEFIGKIHDVAEGNKSYSMVIYGKNGTGKTRTSATLPKPLLLADVKEKGYKSIKGVEKIKIKEIKTWKDFVTLYWFLKNYNSSLKEPFKTVVIDTLTFVEQLAINSVMKKEEEDFGMVMSTSIDIKTPYLNDYGKASSLLKAWVIRFRDLTDEGINVVFNVQEKKDNNEDSASDDYTVFPQIMKSVRTFVCAAVDFIIHTEIKEITRTVGNEIKSLPIYVARVGPSSKYVTKFRIPPGIHLPVYVQNPSHEQIMELSEGRHKTQINKNIGGNENGKD